MAELTDQQHAAATVAAYLSELVQQLEEVYSIAAAGEVLLGDDKGPAYNLFLTIQRLTVDRKITRRMGDELKRLATT